MKKNDEKGNENAPDYRLVVTSKEEKQQELSQSEITKAAMNDESDPFAEFGKNINEDLLPF